jgi:hypothetical protein
VLERNCEGGDFLFLQMEEKAVMNVWLLRKVEVLVAHYLVENKILQHLTHILDSANILVLLILLPAKQKQNAHISFHCPLWNKIYD